MRQATMATARGSTVRATIEYVKSVGGETLLDRVLGRLSGPHRKAAVESSTVNELPYETLLALWRATDAELGPSRKDWVVDSGAFAIDSLGVKLYGGLLRKESPVEFLTQSVSLFRLYYAPGDMVPVQVESGRAVLRLVGFDSGDDLFCRRQTGGLQRAAELAGGKSVRVKHVRCAHEGDAFCEWELSWER
jgi:hypothetical protein